jgi:hypothetical protein
VSMSTPEQKRDRLRFRRLLQREGLSGVMNDTKWGKLLEALMPFEGALEFRRKDVRDPVDPTESWHSDIYYAFSGWHAIEWIEIKARSRPTPGRLSEQVGAKVVTDTLRAVGAPFTASSDRLRVWGYLRPGVSPDWETQNRTTNGWSQ